MSDTKITKNDDSTVTLEGEIAAADFEKHRAASLKKLAETVSIDGFRKGHVPHDMLVKHVGEYAVLEEMAERALSERYPALLVEHEIDAIGRPEVAVTKLAAGNPLGFKITTAVMPKIELPDYKKIAAETAAKNPVGDAVVTDEEVGTFVGNLLAQKAKAEGKEDEALELTDELAQTFGDFKTADEMRAKIKDGMGVDKRREAQEKRRLAILEALVAETKFALPAILIEAEQNKLLAQFKMDLKRMGIEPKAYFERIKKTEDEFRADMRPDAEKRARIQLIINEIALAEKINPTKEEVQKEVDHILSHHEPHEGHDEAHERESAMLYVATVLTNEKVLKFLEEQA